MSPTSGGIPIAEVNAAMQERILQQPMLGSCLLCDWLVTGTAAEVIEAQKEHRLKVHNRRHSSRRGRRVPTGRGWKQMALTDQDKLEIEQEVRRRKRLHGIGES